MPFLRAFKDSLKACVHNRGSVCIESAWRPAIIAEDRFTKHAVFTWTIRSNSYAVIMHVFKFKKIDVVILGIFLLQSVILIWFFHLFLNFLFLQDYCLLLASRIIFILATSRFLLTFCNLFSLNCSLLIIILFFNNLIFEIRLHHVLFLVAMRCTGFSFVYWRLLFPLLFSESDRTILSIYC